MSYSPETTAGSDGGEALAAGMPRDIIQTEILNRVDGSTLAAASCASTELRFLCKDDDLWRRICNSQWPSTVDPRVGDVIAAFPEGHRSFYSDAFSVFRSREQGETRSPRAAGEIVSAVDIHFEGKLIYSKVLETETSSSWFLNTPFRLELLDPKETTAAIIAPPGNGSLSGWENRLSLSWILIDPVTKRAMTAASREAIDVRGFWIGEGTDTGTQLRYAAVAATDAGEMVECAATISCSVEDGQKIRLRQVSLEVQDMDDKTLSGKDSLWVLSNAMEGRRRKTANGSEKNDYEVFVRMKERRKQSALRREKVWEMAIMAIEIAILFGIWKYLIWVRR